MLSFQTDCSPRHSRGDILPVSRAMASALQQQVYLAADNHVPFFRAESLAQDDTAVPRSKALRVLVVDDNRDAADMLSALLSAAGYEVQTDYHPAAALSRASREQFDAFVLDIGLPDLDGHELARRLQESMDGRGAVFIAVTGYGNSEDRQRSADAGFRHHFTKPAQLMALLDALGQPHRN